MSNKHGVFIKEEATEIGVPQRTDFPLVVVGTAPVNVTDNPESLVNTPILATSAAEAIGQLGYSTDFEKYTLCSAMYVTKNMYQIRPVVYVNVLDPAKHKKALSDTAISVTDMQGVLNKTGVLKEGLNVQIPGTTDVYTLVEDADSGDNPSTEGWYVHEDDTYVPTSDTYVHTDTTYVEVTPTSHTAVGTENPSTEGWYALEDNVYTLSTADSCSEGDIFYSIVEGSTSPNAGDNPSSEGWYVLSGENYTLSVDTHVVSGASYYVKSTVSSPITLEEGTDYTLTFDKEGNLVITMIVSSEYAGTSVLSVSGYILDSTMVTKDDIIGSIDIATGKETGMEVIRQIYPKLGMVPGILIAPYWSQTPEVGIALMAKAASINEVFKSMAYIDLEADKYTAIKTAKEESGFTSEYSVICWPSVMVGGNILPLSVVAAIRTLYYDAANDDVPSRSPSNISLAITGTCLPNGTEVMLDQAQATVVGEYGVLTATNLNGFKLWGNHTGAYPSSNDAKDIWISLRRMFNWQGNTFILTYFSEVDQPMNTKLIENIVDSENIRCGAFVPDHWAGASIEYRFEDNPATDIISGRITFRQHISPYTPAETIENILNYDVDMLKETLTGGEES